MREMGKEPPADNTSSRFFVGTACFSTCGTFEAFNKVFQTNKYDATSYIHENHSFQSIDILVLIYVPQKLTVREYIMFAYTRWLNYKCSNLLFF